LCTRIRLDNTQRVYEMRTVAMNPPVFGKRDAITAPDYQQANHVE
jgi:hypothetical protein